LSSGRLENQPLKPVLEQLSGLIKTPPDSVLASLTLSGVAYDSRQIKQGDAFFCIPGQKSNGNQFIADAVAAGASCIFSEQSNDAEMAIAQIVVSDVRQALAEVAACYFDQPSRKTRLLGVTGTNGKTTTTHLVEHMLDHAGKQVGLIGTLGARWSQDGKREYHDIGHTTPQASDLQKLLFDMVARGVCAVAMEVSSHALALK
jgi:UDP-N-acetylmuramoyl-L-alanyl-D-glutamate--2,6-diaminopimelate ligase